VKNRLGKRSVGRLTKVLEENISCILKKEALRIGSGLNWIRTMSLVGFDIGGIESLGSLPEY
jgi:hypothetical protein